MAANMIVNGYVVPATKMALFSGFAEGREVCLSDNVSNLYVRGHIQGVGLESGYMPPGSPHQFLVKLRISASARHTAGETVEVYVHTLD